MSASTESRNGKIGSVFAWFVHWEAAGSILLLLCTVAALAWANSPWFESYFHLQHTKISVAWGEANLSLSLHHWINDGLMVIFFFVVGLEIKREVVLGQLSSVKRSILPVAGALGGMIVPAAFYVALNAGGEGSRGWGVPMATDIAFALGILALFGKRVPIGLKVFLTALAIADDLGAVLVIALFYTDQILFVPLVVAGVFLLLIFAAIVFRVRRPGIYILLIVGVWLGVFLSGVHATVAGILVAFLVPVRTRLDPKQKLDEAEASIAKLKESHLTAESMIENRAQLDAINELRESAEEMTPPGLALEHYLHPVQVFLVLPLFAFFNAGVRVDDKILETLTNPISLGIIAGLFFGKQIGVTVFSWLAIKSKKADLPDGVNWLQIYGTSCLAGVGFTMSLFVAELAFKDEAHIAEAKLGIICASVLSGIVGALILRKALPKAPPE